MRRMQQLSGGHQVQIRLRTRAHFKSVILFVPSKYSDIQNKNSISSISTYSPGLICVLVAASIIRRVSILNLKKWLYVSLAAGKCCIQKYILDLQSDEQATASF